jgi:hypothetical protein
MLYLPRSQRLVGSEFISFPNSPLPRDKLFGTAAHRTFLLSYYGEAEPLLHCVSNETLGTRRRGYYEGSIYVESSLLQYYPEATEGSTNSRSLP